ncbi:hypothetical protein ABK040_003781 [Willaertia magna]
MKSSSNHTIIITIVSLLLITFLSFFHNLVIATSVNGHSLVNPGTLYGIKNLNNLQNFQLVKIDTITKNITNISPILGSNVFANDIGTIDNKNQLYYTIITNMSTSGQQHLLGISLMDGRILKNILLSPTLWQVRGCFLDNNDNSDVILQGMDSEGKCCVYKVNTITGKLTLIAKIKEPQLQHLQPNKLNNLKKDKKILLEPDENSSGYDFIHNKLYIFYNKNNFPKKEPLQYLGIIDLNKIPSENITMKELLHYNYEFNDFVYNPIFKYSKLNKEIQEFICVSEINFTNVGLIGINLESGEIYTKIIYSDKYNFNDIINNVIDLQNGYLFTLLKTNNFKTSLIWKIDLKNNKIIEEFNFDNLDLNNIQFYQN